MKRNINIKRWLTLTAALATTSFLGLYADAEGPVFSHRSNYEETGISVGFVSKEWVTDFNDGTGRLHENLWGDPDKRLNGLQVGLFYSPMNRYGFGGKFGLYGEFYFSNGYARNCDNFTEYSLYIPAHLKLDLPISRDAKFSFEGGLGANIVLGSNFTNDDDYYYDYDGDRHYYSYGHLNYGDFGYPKRFNFALEAGIGLQISHFKIDFTYSHGLTDHHLYYDEPRSETYQHKFAITIGAVF